MGNKGSRDAEGLKERLLQSGEEVDLDTDLTVGAVYHGADYNGVPFSEGVWDANQFVPPIIKVKDIEFDGKSGWTVHEHSKGGKTTTVRYGTLKKDVYAKILGKNWLFRTGTKVEVSLESDGTALASLFEPVRYYGIMPTMPGGRRRKNRRSTRRKNLHTRRIRKHKK